MSVLTQTDDYLPNPEVEPLNSGLEYLAANQTLQGLDCKFVKVTPANGGTFNRTANMIEFRLPRMERSFIDGSKTSLNLRLLPQPSNKGKTEKMGAYATGSFQNAITRVEVLSASGEVLENIVDYNRCYHPLSVVYASTNQLSGAPSVRDLYCSADHGRAGGMATGKKLSQDTDPDAPTATGANNLVCDTRSLSIPLSLSSLFGPSASKSIPVGLMREGLHCRIYLTNNIPELMYALPTTLPTGGTASTATFDDADSNYQVTNVSLEIKTITFSHAGWEMVKRAIGPGNISWNANQIISNSINTNPADLNVNLLMPNTNYRDVKSMVFSTYYSEIASNAFTFASLMTGTFIMNVLVNGDCYWCTRDQGVDIKDNLYNSRADFMMNLVALQQSSSDLWQVNTQLAPEYYNGNATSALAAINYSPYGVWVQSDTGVKEAPDCVFGHLNGSAADTKQGNKGVAPPYVYCGINCLKSTDKSRRLVGTDLRGRQVVVSMRRQNAIPRVGTGATANDVFHASLQIGVRFDLDPKSGVLRRVC